MQLTIRTRFEQVFKFLAELEQHLTPPYDSRTMQGLGAVVVRAIKSYFDKGGTPEGQWAPTSMFWAELQGKDVNSPLKTKGILQESIRSVPITEGVRAGSSHPGSRRHQFGDAALGGPEGYANNGFFPIYGEHDYTGAPVAGMSRAGSSPSWNGPAVGQPFFVQPDIIARPFLLITQENVDEWLPAFGRELGLAA